MLDNKQVRAMLSLTNAIYNVRVIKTGSHVTVTCLMIIDSVGCKAFNVRLEFLYMHMASLGAPTIHGYIINLQSIATQPH